MDNDDTPYAGSSGHSGGPASEQRADAQDASGRTGHMKRAALNCLTKVGSWGTTVKEFQRETGLGHGACSGVLSRLHKAGRIARLTEQRGGQEVYVLLEHVGPREVVPYRPNRAYRGPAWTVTARGTDADGVAWVVVDDVRYWSSPPPPP